MSIYLQIGTVSYKLPNRTIVGRGDPFTQFSEDRDISRAHLELLRKKEGIFVRDLGSPAGTYLDGKKLPKKKFVKWSEDADLRIGSHTVGLLSSAVESECVKVNKINGNKNSSTYILKWIYSFLFASMMYSTWLGHSDKNFSHKVGVSVLGLVILVGSYLFFMLLFKLCSPKNSSVTAIFLGEDGFTAHYDGGGNMTLKLIEIEEWRRHFNGALVLMKNREVYNFVQMKNAKKLVQYLEQNVSKKELKKSWLQNYGYNLLGFFAGICLIQFDGFMGYFEELIFAFMIFLVAYLYFSKPNKWAPNNRYMNNKKIAVMIGCLTLFMGVSLLTEPSRKELALELQKACKAGDKSACTHFKNERLPASVNK